MQIKIIRNAIYYYYSGLVNLTSETKEGIWFEVDGENVDFSYGDGYLKINCTCKHCSRKPVHKINEKEYILNPLCSRKIACILHLASKYRQKMYQ